MRDRRVDRERSELQSGSIRGRVVDDTGQALPGVSITISGPALISKVTAMTNAEGFFRAPNLTPGAEYEIKTDLKGFETTLQPGIIVNLGRTISVEIKMKASTLQQEVTITASSPTIDVVKSSTSKTVTSDVMASFPLPRGVNGILQVSSGLVGNSFYGDGNNEGGAVMDGVQMVEPDVGGLYLGSDNGMAWDMVDEVEIMGAGATAQFYNSSSGTTNVVMKSGGNEFSGEASVYYTDKSLSQIHLPLPDIQALNLAMPSIPVCAVDTALAVGRPVIKDRLWFMGEFRYIVSKNTGDFRPTVINGKRYNNYAESSARASRRGEFERAAPGP